MKIQLSETIRLETDDYNYKLIETKTITENIGGRGKKAKSENIGSERDEVIGYYTTLKGALTGFMNIEIKRCDANTIQEVLSHIKRVEKTIEGVLEK